jgi:hypothetical protein
MNFYKAIMLAEGSIKAKSEDEVLEAWQYLVDTGLVWNLQGSLGRAAQALIDQGLISPAGATV